MEDESWKDVLRRDAKLRACYGFITLLFLAMLYFAYCDYQTAIFEAIEKTGLTEEGMRSIATVSTGSVLMIVLVMLTMYHFMKFINNPKPAPPRRVIAEEVGELRKELDELKAAIIKEDLDDERRVR